MKAISILLCLLGLTSAIFAGESKIYPIAGPSQITCCGLNQFSVDVENINPTFTIENISGKWVVKRQNTAIYDITIMPREADLPPGETSTFVMEIPMELLLLDGLLEIEFEFLSDFDLNPDPTADFLSEVDGCGIIKQEVIDFFLSAYSATAEEFDAYMFLFDQLLKPGTIIKGSNGDTWSTEVEAFSWMMMMFDPGKKFEQQVMLVTLDANTLNVQEIDANWYPLINDIAFYPRLDDPERISGGNLPPPGPPPVPLEYDAYPSLSSDSVCAILVEGIEENNIHMQGAFQSAVEHMKQVLQESEKGPRLEESSILIRKCIDGYNKASLIQDLNNLQNNYKKVFFYYGGHGSNLGHMCTGFGVTDWITYEEFAEELFKSGANQYCIMVDACFSGKLIDAINQNPDAAGKDIEVVTGTDDEKSGEIIEIDLVTVKQSELKFTLQFFNAMNEKTTDVNMDGSNSFAEGYKYIIDKNLMDIVMKQNPLLKKQRNYTLMKWGEIVEDAAVQQLGEDVLEKAAIHVHPEVLPGGTTVLSFDQVNQFTVANETYFGWIEPNADALFGKLVFYSFTDPVTGATTFSDPVEFWPTIPSNPDYVAFDPEGLYKKNFGYLIGAPENTIAQDEVPVDTVTAGVGLFISTPHPDPVANAALKQSVATVFDNTTREDNIENLTCPDSTKLLVNATLERITDALSTLGAPGRHFFVYITGNVTSTGELALGNGPQDWIPLTDLYVLFLDKPASGYTFYVDFNNAQQTINEALQNNLFEDKKVDVLASTGTGKQATFQAYVDGQGVMTGAHMSHTLKTMFAYGNQTPSVTGTIQSTLKDKSVPVVHKVRYTDLVDDIIQSENLPGLDLNVETAVRAAIVELQASQEIQLESQTTSAADVIEISPVRRWLLSSEGLLDPSLTALLHFTYHPELDSLQASNGILGVVTRASSAEEWQAHYPVSYDPVGQIITASDVSLSGEWAIALVSPTGVEQGHINGLHIDSVFPNPVADELHISLATSEARDLSFEVNNLNGHTIIREEATSYTPGLHSHMLCLDMAPAGPYVLTIRSDGNRLSRFIIVQ